MHVYKFISHININKYIQQYIYIHTYIYIYNITCEIKSYTCINNTIIIRNKLCAQEEPGITKIHNFPYPIKDISFSYHVKFIYC